MVMWANLISVPQREDEKLQQSEFNSMSVRVDVILWSVSGHLQYLRHPIVHTLTDVIDLFKRDRHNMWLTSAVIVDTRSCKKPLLRLSQSSFEKVLNSSSKNMSSFTRTLQSLLSHRKHAFRMPMTCLKLNHNSFHYLLICMHKKFTNRC